MVGKTENENLKYFERTLNSKVKQTPHPRKVSSTPNDPVPCCQLLTAIHRKVSLHISSEAISISPEE